LDAEGANELLYESRPRTSKIRFSDSSVRKASIACYLLGGVALIVSLIFSILYGGWQSSGSYNTQIIALVDYVVFGITLPFSLYCFYRFFRMGRAVAYRPAVTYGVSAALQLLPLLVLFSVGDPMSILAGVVALSPSASSQITFFLGFLVFYIPWLILSLFALSSLIAMAYKFSEESGQNEFRYAIYLIALQFLLGWLLPFGISTILYPLALLVFGLGLGRASSKSLIS
jgi:hypothetical protein